MRDFLGNEIHEGDEAVYLSFRGTSPSFRQGKVGRMTQKCAYIDSTRKEEHKIISLTALKRSSINQEAQKPCELCIGSALNHVGIKNYFGFRIYLNDSGELPPQEEMFKFCPKCGRPLNEQAWEELERNKEFGKMSMKKYKFTGETQKISGRTLHRIRAIKDFGDVRAGNLGGWIQSERNLWHNGNAWVYDDACVYDHAQVTGDARVTDSARVYGRAWLCGNARVSDNAIVCGNTELLRSQNVSKDAQVLDFKHVFSVDDINTTFYRGSGGEIYAACGYLSGDLQSFLKEAEKDKHASNQYIQALRAAAELAKIMILGDE